MVRCVGLDVHERIVQAGIIDQDGKVLASHRFPCVREELERFARQTLTPADRVALEATTNTWGIVRVIKPFVAEVVVSNPLCTKAIASAKVKTDKVDALVLAQLLRCDFLPRVWEPPDQTQELRALTSHRSALVADRTRIKNRIHSVLHRRLIAEPTKDLFGDTGLAWLRSLELDQEGRLAIDTYLHLLGSVNVTMARLDALLAKMGHEDPRVKLLMTLPGVDYAVAQTVLAALGDPMRFSDGHHAASYLGLVPSTRQSADHCYHGPITKQGNSHARWMLVQAAQRFSSNRGPLGVFFRRLARRKNRNVAVVAVARKLVVIAWHMLSHEEPYRYAEPRTTLSKLSRLRVKATGRRRRGGLTKGSPRPANYGTGNGTREIPSLQKACVDAGLPEPKSLRPGEAKMVRKLHLEDFLQQIHTTRRIARRTRQPQPAAPQPTGDEVPAT